MSSAIIKNGYVLDLDLPFEPADILVDGDQIVRVGRDLPEAGHSVIDASGKVVMPGLINCHTHSGQILDRGFADNCQLDVWLVYAGLGSPPLSDRDLYVLTLWSVIAQLTTGCTACLDHVTTLPLDRFDSGQQAIMQAYVDSGFRAAVAPSMGDMEFFSTLPTHLLFGETPPAGSRPVSAAKALVAAMRRFLQEWSGKHARLQPFIGPGAPQRCTDELLAGCFGLSEEFDAGIHTHLLEARSQWFACQRRFGGSPVAFMDRQGWLSPRLSCAHGVWLSEADAEMLAANGACLSHNPVSNLRLASGILNLQMMLAKGAPVALGADGAASNDNQNMWEVLKLTALLHKTYGPRTSWITAEQALRLCWLGGARLLRQPIGAIRVGHQADLVVLGGPDLFIRPKEQMIASLVYGELGQSVETVMIAGEVLLRDGKLTRVDLARIRQEALDIVERSNRHLPQREAFFAERQGYVERLTAVADQLDGPPVRTAHLT
jgi:5-methylthioadenosine/S-adenosylhomocysteine deaminase